ncbi:hypothetical protein [Methanosarcina acetivorans]|uniref:Uncharacterized protein n=1 Tax=Methanosarcina acetivorans (strain ATCC 35395 / DSM 2834 / JCM 12185 / C2A) TaxID=188937 RepID=Q8TPL5_METAC|nr:hypothetical protein [Methanosarcina acetivorans]AAM05298.1 predicted protein [Methanosarcina acetivorans C2A]
MNPLFPKIEWLDNCEAKTRIKYWLTSNSRFSTFVADSFIQLTDLSEWIIDHTNDDTVVGEFKTRSETFNVKHQLIDTLVKDLKKKNVKFVTYSSTLSKIDSLVTRPINLDQKIDIRSALGGVKTENINQKANVYLEYLPLEKIREDRIEQLRDSFLEDLCLNGSNVLLLFKFGGKGFNALHPKFKDWFIDGFCRNTIEKSNIRICVLNKGDIEDIDIENEYHEELGNIKEEAFLDETHRYVEDANICYGFCFVITNIHKHSPITYDDFKCLLTALLIDIRENRK